MSDEPNPPESAPTVVREAEPVSTRVGEKTDLPPDPTGPHARTRDPAPESPALAAPTRTDRAPGATGSSGAGAAASGGAAVAGYEILGELGRGAMGVVYKARHEKLHRLVALKMTLGELADGKDLIRFLAEAEAVAAVKHENVVQVYDYGESGGRPYMALEYCSGGSLAQRLRTGAPFAPGEAAALVARIAAGVAAAHQEGIVHRDLKPGNILLQVAGQKGEPHPAGADDGGAATVVADAAATPKVADFGLAKRATSDLTATQAVMGTPAYMSPEQAGGKTKFVGPQADVWALGVILYELLAGARPFLGSTTDEVLARVLRADPVAVRTLKGAVPRDLDLICRKCLEKNPADRYPSARELADDLARYTRGEPISVRPLTAAARTARWVRRNPVVAGLLVLVVAVTLGLIGSLYSQYRQALGRADTEREARESADRAREQAEAARLSAARADRAELDKARADAEAAAAKLDRARADAKAAAEASMGNLLVGLLNDQFRSSDPLAVFFGDSVPLLGDPGASESKRVILGPVLRTAAARIRASLTDRSVALVRAKLLAAIGINMKALAMFADARDVLGEALALRRAHLPAADPDVWQSETDLGRLEVDFGALTEAAERFRRLYAEQKAAGADEATLLTTRLHEGFALTFAGLAESEAVFKEVVVGRERLLGKLNKDTLFAQLALVGCYLDRGRPADVLPLVGPIRAAVDAQPDKRVRDVFDQILRFQGQLAAAHALGNDGLGALALRQAIGGMRDVVARLCELVPDDHFVLCIVRFELARLLLRTGAGAEADALFARVLADTKRTIGLAHPKAMLMLEIYSDRLAATKQAGPARDLYDQYEAANRERFGPDNPWRTVILLHRARFELGQNKPDAALAAARGAIELFGRGKFLATPGALVDVFQAAKALGRSPAPELRAAARELFAALRPRVARVFGPASPEAVILLTQEGRFLYDVGDRRAAAGRFDEARELSARLPALDPAEANALLFWCGRLELDRGAFAKAEEHFRAAAAAAGKMSFQTAYDREEHARLLGDTLAAQGRYAEAVPLFEEVRRQRNGRGAVEHDRAWADMRVATAQLAAGDRAGYRKTVAGLFQKFGKSNDINVLARVVWGAALAADPDGWDLAATEARFGATFQPGTAYPWGYRVLALVRVRAGKFEEAEAALRKAGAVHPADHFIRGLIAAARGDRAAARTLLAKGDDLIAAQRPSAENPFAYAGRLWHVDLEAELLRSELRAAVAVPAAPPPREKR
jgi:hypothetical protein